MEVYTRNTVLVVHVVGEEDENTHTKKKSCNFIVLFPFFLDMSEIVAHKLKHFFFEGVGRGSEGGGGCYAWQYISCDFAEKNHHNLH